MSSRANAREPDYSKKSAIQALRDVGLRRGDTVFTHIGLGFLGVPSEGATMETACQVIWEAFQEVLGDEGTWLVPTYSYSFTRDEEFNPTTTPSDVGPFTEYFRANPDVVRSRDPIFSVAGIGPAASEILSNLPRQSFGEDCVYERLVQTNAKLCNLGVGFRYATFIHYVEQKLRVPYRFPKLFTGEVTVNGATSEETWLYNVRVLAENGLPDLRRAEVVAKDQGRCATAQLGRSEVTLITATAMLDLCETGIAGDPWFLASGPPADVLSLEQARTRGVPSYLPVPLVDTAHAIRELNDVPRDAVSAGAEAVIRRLSNLAPLRLIQYPTGTISGGYTVPEKWSCGDTRILNLDGAVVASSESGQIAPISYSRPIDAEVSREDLFARLVVSKDANDVLPYAETSYRSAWGLRTTPVVRDSLTANRYRVSIPAEFSFGEIYASDWRLGNPEGPIVLVCAWLGYAGITNRGLSGALAGIEAFQKLDQADINRLDIRLLLVSHPSALTVYIDRECPTAEPRSVMYLDRLASDGRINVHVQSDVDTPTIGDIGTALTTSGINGDLINLRNKPAARSRFDSINANFADVMVTFSKGEREDATHWFHPDANSPTNKDPDIPRAARRISESGSALADLLKSLDALRSDA